MTRSPVYMDSHATTRVDPRVVQAMLPCFDAEYGNAASGILYGSLGNGGCSRSAWQTSSVRRT